MSIELHYADSGVPEQAGTLPLVVLHGLFGSADNWRSHIRHWRQTRRVVAVDLRNHGRSGHTSGMRYEDMAADVLSVMDQLDIQQCDLLGHSMGGKVAMTMARCHPQRVARLIVADIAPIAYEHGHDDIFRAHRLVEDALPESRKEADEAMAEAIDNRTTRQFLATNLMRDDQGILGWRVGLDFIEEGYGDIVAPPGGEAPYTGPALVLRGEHSDYVTDDALPVIADIMPASKVDTIKGAGHWLHAEQPEAFIRAIDAFLNTDRSR
ncbi:alpha/beta fold hydrolase [Kushneria phyllosphaerae]|uniref:Esterase YbfF n=1 Tax=Kushneria phyllosphaerae TaxID=2100822 RepID=A0A2R8CPG5_9GAMM|nr:alpha/beta fold hydrolase [Kushneria phyllosphaerae]SPJ34722.1 Esterase YbfF [Kushneria phyllosphaerae]